jgi:hypothetical protein
MSQDTTIQVCSPAEVRELAIVMNVPESDVFPGSDFSNPYYHFSVDDQEFHFFQLRPDGHLVGSNSTSNMTDKTVEQIRNYIQTQLHTGNE